MTASARMELDDRGVLTVTLSRPEQRNPLDVEAWRVLGEAFGERAHTPGVRAVVLRGEGDSFCSGLDRSLLVQVAGGGNGQGADIDASLLQGTVDSIDSCPVPTLAVIQGACVGGGVALMLACDLRVAADDAFFVMMEMRYAFLPDLGHIPRLQREVGMARAKEMLFFADRVPAATMERWGVVNEVVPRAGLDEAAARWTARCAATPPLAIAHLKPLMLADPAGADVTEGQRSALEANLRLLLHTRDFREGLAAQAERRAPNFAGE
ncbi:MAG: enoyl-CoA hydratase/isomerase family protein [Chloroflexi bacterium]|nr:MAG: enoyl-CoA hydratase/isomerase family protein [Chloroflexota bacterium]